MPGFDNDNAYFLGADTRGVSPVVNQMSDGKLLIGRTSADVNGSFITANNLTPGAGISIANGPGTITISVAGGATAVDSFGMQTGTNPVIPTGAGLVTFNGAVVAAGVNPVRTDGIGPNTMALEVQRTQAIGATDATKVGLAVFDSAKFTVDANGFVSMAGGGTTQTLTPDVGGAVSPSLNNINILGSTSTLPTDSMVTHNFGGVATMGIENRRWLTAFVVDPSAIVGSRGTYTTIQAAINAASAAGSGTVFIRPGTYTENITLAANVDLCGFPSSGVGSLFGTGTTIINGKILHNTTGNVNIAGLTLKTNGDYLLEVSGANDSSVFLTNCYFAVTNNTGILHSSSGNSEIDIRYSEGEITIAGIAFLSKSSASDFKFYWCDIRNIGATATNSTVSAGQLAVRWSRWYQGITTSGTGFITALDSQFDNFGAAVVPLTIGGTGTADSFKNCFINGNSQACCTIAAGSTARFTQCCFETTNTPVISGAGSVVWSDLGFDSTGRGITVTTQTPRNFIPGAVTVKTPGAYPYTTVPQDYLILVDTSSARTINLNASPATGQIYIIKDNVGSAAANNITITPAAGNIDGSGSYTINTNYGSVTLIYNGTQWNAN